MKKTFLLIAFTGIFTDAAFAQEAKVASPVTQPTPKQEVPQQRHVPESDLPNSIKEKFSSKKYKDWKFLSAMMVEKSDKSYYYIIEMIKNDEKKTFKMDKNGKKLKD